MVERLHENGRNTRTHSLSESRRDASKFLEKIRGTAQPHESLSIPESLEMRSFEH
jgi:hypothetical protein